MAEVKKVDTPAPATREELARYLRENLRLEVKSEKESPNGSIYRFQITLKLEGSPVSTVSFLA